MTVRPAFAAALSSIVEERRKASLAVLGLLVGIASVVTVLGAGSGARHLLLGELGAMGRPAAMTVTPNYGYLARTGWKRTSPDLTREDDRRLRSNPGLVAGASPEIRFGFRIARGDRTVRARLLGVSRDYSRLKGFTLAKGRWIGEGDESHLRNVAVLGSGLEKALFGFRDPVGETLRIGTVAEVVVIGVLEPAPASVASRLFGYDDSDDRTLFFPASAAERYAGSSLVSTLVVEAASPDLLEESRRFVLEALALGHGRWETGEDKYSVEFARGAIESMNHVSDTATALVAAIAAISLLAAGFGMMDLMLISVKERTGEIGTRKALGATKGTILLQFLAEAFVLCGIGGMLGIAFADAAIHLVASLAGWPALLESGPVLLALGLSFATVPLAATLPAIRAANLSPSEAIRFG
jgi:ABC-type antimicrobial peptide transport system permease subunit